MLKDHLEPVLRVEHLKVEIPTRRGPLKPLDDITFTIDAGQILGMVGEGGNKHHSERIYRPTTKPT